jgi:hypothetical protein
MFDFYSQSSANTRTVAFLNPKTLPTWPDMVRQSRDTDVAANLYKASSESPLSLFVASLSARFHRWQLNLGYRPAKRVRVQRHYLPVKRHSPIHR